MCLIHLQSIKMKNRICFKYCWGICLMQYVWNMLNIILEVIETFHTHSPCVLYVCTACTLGPNLAPSTQPEYPGTEKFCQPGISLWCPEMLWSPGLSQGSRIPLLLCPVAHHLGLLIAPVSLHLPASFLLNKLDPNLLWVTRYQVTGYYFSSLQHIACQSGH